MSDKKGQKVHYHLDYSSTEKKPRHNKILGFVFLAIFLILVGKVWVPFAFAAFNTTMITVLPPDWEQAYVAATLPQTASAKTENKLIIKTSGLNIEAPIIEGTTPADLLNGVGRDQSSVTPGSQGRVVISGHRFWPHPSPWARVFFSLPDKLKVGNKITVIYEGKTYTYLVKERWEKPKDHTLEKLGPSTNSLLTIYTCGPTPYSAKTRIGFDAVLDETETKNNSNEVIKTLQEGIL